MATNSLVFVLGPSCIGKSTLLRRFDAERSDCDLTVLDDLTTAEGMRRGFVSKLEAFPMLQAVGTESFFLLGMSRLFELVGSRDSERLHLVDVGAAFQNVPMCARLSKFFTVICLIADPRASYDRYCEHRANDRTFDEHCSTEFSKVRRTVYQSATYSVDSTNLSEAASYAEFVSLIDAIERERASKKQAAST